MRLAAVCKIWEFNPHNLVNTAWAFATLAVENSELLETVRLLVVYKIWEFIPRGLKFGAWGSATLVFRPLRKKYLLCYKRKYSLLR